METWIHFSANVNQDSSGKLVHAITDAINAGSTKINLLINTTGGTVLHGRGVYNFLRSLSVECDTYNLGQVDSIGGLMYLSGTNRYTVSNGSFLIHGVSLTGQGSYSLAEKLLQERLNSLKQDREGISMIYAERTAISLADFEILMLDGTTLSAVQAVERGVATHIKNPEVPAGTHIVSIVD